MALKTFNVEEAVYNKFRDLCKGNGLSMSKQVEFFMRSMVEEEPTAKAEYIAKLDRIRKGNFIKVDNFAKRYGL